MNFSYEETKNQLDNEDWKKAVSSIRRKANSFKLFDLKVNTAVEKKDGLHKRFIKIIRVSDYQNELMAGFDLEYGSDLRLRLTLSGSKQVEISEVASFALDKIIQSASLNGFDTILSKSSFSSSIEQWESYEAIKKASDYLGGNYPHSLLGIRKDPYSTANDNLEEYFIPVHEENIARKIAMYKEFRAAIDAQKIADVTFQENTLYVNAEFCELYFYYEGYTGRVRMNYFLKPQMHLNEGINFWEENIQLTENQVSVSDIKKTFQSFIFYIVNKNALPNLLNPPDKLIKAFVKEHFPSDLPFFYIYNLLLKRIDGKEIERRAVTDLNPVHHYTDKERSAWIVEMFGSYFVICYVLKEAYEFSIKEEAFSKFNEVLRKIELINYEKRLKEIDNDFQKAIHAFQSSDN